MTSSLENTVRRVLASHLARSLESVQPAHRLRRDLGLLPFDLVLVAQRLEELEALHIPEELLPSARTVAELTKLLRSCAEERSVGPSHDSG